MVQRPMTRQGWGQKRECAYLVLLSKQKERREKEKTLHLDFVTVQSSNLKRVGDQQCVDQGKQLWSPFCSLNRQLRTSPSIYQHWRPPPEPEFTQHYHTASPHWSPKGGQKNKKRTPLLSDHTSPTLAFPYPVYRKTFCSHNTNC